jgi:hypothetical protein
MRVHRDWIGTGTLWLAVWLAATAARADDAPPLMVVVEVGPDVGQDAADIRKAIGAELHRTVVAPSEAASTNASDLLLVVVNHDRIVLSLHEHSDERVSRSIPAPADKAARLRAVTWLAGNVARDQVTPLLTLPPAGHADAAAPMSAPVEAGDAIGAAEPGPASTQPAPLLVPTTLGPANDLQLATTSILEPALPRMWTVAASTGEAVQYGNQWEGSSFSNRMGVSTQIEVLRHRGDGYLYGGVADFGPVDGHRLGVAVAGGVERALGRFSLETSLGLGFETAAGQNEQTSTAVNSSLSGRSSSTTVTSGYAWTPYARLFASMSHPVTRSWDVVLRVGGHAPITGLLATSFATGSLGVRLRLP